MRNGVVVSLAHETAKVREMTGTTPKRHVLLIVAVSFTILHFIITSLVGHYIAIQVGSIAGQSVANMLKESTGNTSSSDNEINDRLQAMRNNIDEQISRWKLPVILISLPIRPIIQPLLSVARKGWIYGPVVSHQLSKEQAATRLVIIDTGVKILNSLSFGLLIYLGCWLFYKRKRVMTTE